MTLTWLLVAAAAVTVWSLGWSFVARKLSNEERPLPWRVDASEALLVTMFASLWFDSLGHGAWWVLFLVLACLVEGPVRLRHQGDRPDAVPVWRAVLLGAVRWLGAGLILSLLL